MPDARLDESKLIHKGRIFTVTLDTVGYPDGRTVNMEVVRHPGSVVLIPMPAPDRVLLVRQYRYVVDSWLWELPAGTMEPGESAERAALRECQEEVAKIARRSQQLLSLYPSPGFCDEVMNFFLLTDLRDPAEGDEPAAPDPDELLNVQEFSIADARAMVRNGEIEDMKTVVGLNLV